MNFVNLTPHDINISVNGQMVVIPKSSQQARVKVTQEAQGTVDVDGISVPVFRNVYGQVEGLPEPQKDTVFVVSILVIGRVSGRTDVVCPDTGPTAIRDDKGQIKAVARLICG